MSGLVGNSQRHVLSCRGSNVDFSLSCEELLGGHCVFIVTNTK